MEDNKKIKVPLTDQLAHRAGSYVEGIRLEDAVGLTIDQVADMIMTNYSAHESRIRAWIYSTALDGLKRPLLVQLLASIADKAAQQSKTKIEGGDPPISTWEILKFTVYLTHDNFLSFEGLEWMAPELVARLMKPDAGFLSTSAVSNPHLQKMVAYKCQRVPNWAQLINGKQDLCNDLSKLALTYVDLIETHLDKRNDVQIDAS